MTTACHLITAQELPSPLSEAEERHCVCVICFLTDDACNRAKIRTSGAFKRLLELAKNTTSGSLLSMVIWRWCRFSLLQLIHCLLIHI